MKTTTNIIYSACALFALAYFALSRQARATCQEGCLTNRSTVLGESALINNTTGGANTAVGFDALFSNTSGADNTGIGYQALYYNTSGSDNTANGVVALYSNTTGRFNTAAGFFSLYYNTTGIYNTANGFSALVHNTAGCWNTAIGTALNSNTTGYENTAIGLNALANNTTSHNNVALGVGAGVNLTTGHSNIDIGNGGRTGESGNIRIGTRGAQRKTFIAGISGVTVPGGVGVIVGSNGQLGTVVSSARFKEAIQPMDKASEAILALRPVTFRYKHELDPEAVPQFGLVAEEVEKVNRALVAYDDHGKPYSVRYDAVNAMLLNEFLKEHQTVQELKSAAVKQEAMIASQQK